MNVSNCSLKDECEYVKELQQENKQLKDNWNKLKESLKNEQEEYFKKYPDNLFMAISVDVVLNKMQELEGSDSNENNK